jgi:response regulator RpfG family c-di-GMP phosphodiesterase
MSDKVNVLYIDDKPNNLFSFRANFRYQYEIFTCLSVAEALTVLNHHSIHVLIADQRMPDMTGIEFMEKAAGLFPEPVKIVLTAHRDLGPILEAFKDGRIFCYHGKPWDFDALEFSIEKAYHEYCKKTS